MRAAKMENIRLPSSIFCSSVMICSGDRRCELGQKHNQAGQTYLLFVIVLLVLLVILLVILVTLLVLILALLLDVDRRLLLPLHPTLGELLHHLQELLAIVLEEIVGNR